ncbi:MAG TPA: hypothetical protein VKE74_04870 [Gemmataceae bacterium]|nr:hypothetical protein [Gemmataceae bacterium]
MHTVFTGTARGQAGGQAPVFPDPGPDFEKRRKENHERMLKDSDPDKFFERVRAGAEGEKEKERRAKEEESRKQLRAWLRNPLFWCVVAGIVLSVGSGVYIRLSATTDPQKLAASDPWIRAHLAQSRPGGSAHTPGHAGSTGERPA